MYRKDDLSLGHSLAKERPRCMPTLMSNLSLRRKEKLSGNIIHNSHGQFDEELKLAIFCSSSMMRRINSCSLALTRPLLLIVSRDIPFIFAAP